MDEFTNNRNGINSYYSPQELNKLIRLFSSQAAMWTRAYIVSVFSDMEDVEVIRNRLYEVGRDFSDLFGIYFSNDIPEELEGLIRSYMDSFMETVLHIKNNEIKLSEISEEEWRNNGVDLAQFLASINPYWGAQQFLVFIEDHIDMTIDQIMQRVNKEYALEVYQYDFIEYHSLMIADILTSGIIELFYKK